MIKKPTVIVRASEAEEIIEALRKLAEVSSALGHVEDSLSYEAFAESLERRLEFKGEKK